MWAIALILTILAIICILLLGVPVALGFLALNAILSLVFIGYPAGGLQVVGSIESSLGNFNLLPIPLFVLMGELLFRAGVATRALNGIALWLGRLPGKLALVNVGTGTMFAMFSGSAVATTSTVGKMVLPDMVRQGYNRQFAMSSVLAAGGLAAIIPPSSLAVLVGTIGGISVGGMLLGGLIPGLLIAAIAAGYIIVRSMINTSLVPTAVDTSSVDWAQRWRALFRDILPLAAIMLLVLGLILTGVATPTEAAALGTAGSFLMAVTLGNLRAKEVLASLMSTVKVACGILLIIAGAAAYSQMLAYSGSISGLISFTTSLDVAPILIVILMLFVVFLMGSPLEPVSIMLITLPAFMPIVMGLDFNPIWFGVMFLIMIDVGNLTPPLGLQLFALSSAAGPGVTFWAIVRAAWPIIAIEVVAIALMLAFPGIVTFLPDLLR